MIRVQPSLEYSLKKPEYTYAKLIPRKPDRISYNYSFRLKEEEVFLLICATGPRLSTNQKIAKLVNEIRGGDFGLLGTSALLAAMVLIFSIGESFVLNLPIPIWGLDAPNRFLPPSARHRFPPSYDFLDFLFPRITSYGNRPGGCHIMTGESQ